MSDPNPATHLGRNGECAPDMFNLSDFVRLSGLTMSQTNEIVQAGGLQPAAGYEDLVFTSEQLCRQMPEGARK